MAEAKRTTDLHTDGAYDYCDVLDAIAGAKGGRAQAQQLVASAIAQAAAVRPAVVREVLGASLFTQYKSMDAAQRTVTKQAPGMQSVELPAALATALTQARAQLGDAQLTQILASAPQLGASLPDAVMAQLSGKTALGAGTLASDEKVSSRPAKAKGKSLADQVMEQLGAKT